MKKHIWRYFVLAAALIVIAGPAYADLADATTTVAEGAVEFPVGLVKFVGGILWTVGEVIALPFKAIF